MSEVKELLLTSCQSGQQSTASLWDYKTTNVVTVYKNGGNTGRNSLGKIGNDYIVSIEQQKPLLHYWCINGNEQTNIFKMILPEPANSLAISPNNCYIALSFGNKLGIWQLNSGNLLYFNQKHFQPITIIKFCNEGNYLATAGKDGMLVIYNFGNLIDLQNNYFSQSNSNLVEPLHCRTDHTASITDMHMGSYESKSFIITVSDDKTAILYNLMEGVPILKLIFDNILTSVISNNTFLHFFIGTNNGTIKMINTKDAPRKQINYMTEESNIEQFVGHKKRINCLALNMTNEILASGSDENNIFLWDVRSKTHLQTIELRSSITNLLFTLSHVNMFNDSYKPGIIIKPMQKTFNDSNVNCEISIYQTEDICFSDEEIGSNTITDFNLLEKYNNLKHANKQLYEKLIKLTNNV